MGNWKTSMRGRSLAIMDKTGKISMAAAFIVAIAAPPAATTQEQLPARPDAREPVFEVLSCVAAIPPNQTTVIEAPDYLRYITPYFTANATVKCSTPPNDDYTVGFIQQVDFIDLRMEYTRATTSWEMPYLPISDASGARPPWYHTLEGRRIIKGGSEEQVAETAVNDNFDVKVAWREPLPPYGVSGDGKPDLRGVRRNQKFTLWLVARRSLDGELTILKKVAWQMQVEISVNPELPLGSRATVKPVDVSQPTIIDAEDMDPAEGIPPEALKAPSANEAQEFWWTPKQTGIGERVHLSG